MKPYDVPNVLVELSSFPRSFNIQELMELTDTRTNLGVLINSLYNDNRFIVMKQIKPFGRHFISKKILYRRFVWLVLRLAQAQVSYLSENQLRILMSSLRLHDEWKMLPQEIIDFGEKYKFLNSSFDSDRYIFPLAKSLSYLTPLRLEIANVVLMNFAKDSIIKYAIQKPIEYWVNEALALFDSRVAYIIKRREGLLFSSNATLDELGFELNISKQRVRQLESAFWNSKKLLLNSRFSELLICGLICNIINNQGSLIISNSDLQIAFIAKCLGIPYVRIPNTNLLAPVDISESIRYQINEQIPWYDQINKEKIVKHLRTSIELCLQYSDIIQISEEISSFYKKHLSKAQKVYITLQSIGKPAHYSRITEEYNQLFPEMDVDEHNIHAILSREQHGVVWIGTKGFFALKEWGYEHPSGKIFDIVKEIVEKAYEKTKKPVSANFVRSEIGKYRQIINPNSLTIALTCNPDLKNVSPNHFVPKYVYSENNDDLNQTDISGNELDRILSSFNK